MTIHEKLQEHTNEQITKDRDFLNRALLRMTGIILAGYFIGTIIALIIEKR